MMCKYDLECFDHDGPLEGTFLGDFNYDIARSVQTYTVPIYGLEQGEQIEINFRDYDDQPNNCMNPLAHSGHGSAFGCSVNATSTEAAVCTNQMFFTQDPGKYRLYLIAHIV